MNVAWALTLSCGHGVGGRGVVNVEAMAPGQSYPCPYCKSEQTIERYTGRSV